MLMRRSFVYIASAAFVMGLFVSQSRAELECSLKQDTRVTDDKTGASLILKRGDLVYSRWSYPAPPSMFIVRGQKFRGVKGVDYEIIDCGKPQPGADLPIVFRNLAGRVQLYNEFGIKADPLPNERLPTAHKCFYIGDGFMNMEISDATFAYYKKKGFSLDNLCMVLRTGHVRFNPETGARVATYIIADGSGPKPRISDELLLKAPSCFARGKLRIAQLSAVLNPIGCKVNYHPWSGRKLDPNEVAYFTSNATLNASGDAGDVAEDSSNLAGDPNKQATAARIRALKNRAAE
jgi:hypothetical protein